MLNVAGSVLFWTFLFVTSVLLFPVAVAVWAVTVLFDRRLACLHAFTCFWGSLYTWFNPLWPVRVDGREHIRADQHYVMVANHLSLLDILVLFRLFRHFKWVSKIENFRIPMIGWNMSMNRYIKLRRGSRESVIEMMETCRQTLGQGNSIMMFPEGTRSPDGRMRDFKPGAFELALETGSPLLPIVIEGTARALPKRGFVLRGRHPIRVRVLQEIPPESFAGADPIDLASQVRSQIAATLGEPERPAAQQATA
jgi:1-acyl-sn-glycerol-3-phosphate acyltransferase